MKKKHFLIGMAAVIFVAFALAQGGPAGSSIGWSTTGSCDSPTQGKTFLCGTSTTVLISVNGAPYVDLKVPPAPPTPPPVYTSFTCQAITAVPAVTVGPVDSITLNNASGTSCAFK